MFVTRCIGPENIVTAFRRDSSHPTCESRWPCGRIPKSYHSSYVWSKKKRPSSVVCPWSRHRDTASSTASYVYKAIGLHSLIICWGLSFPIHNTQECISWVEVILAVSPSRHMYSYWLSMQLHLFPGSFLMPWDIVQAFSLTPEDDPSLAP